MGLNKAQRKALGKVSGKHTRQGNKPGTAKRCKTCGYSACRCN